MINTRIDILDDDAPPEEAGRLAISLDDFGDVWISVIPGQNGKTIRVRTFGGGGSHPEILNDLYSLIQTAIETEKKNRNGSIVVY
jgi:hypothetical protein